MGLGFSRLYASNPDKSRYRLTNYLRVIPKSCEVGLSECGPKPFPFGPVAGLRECSVLPYLWAGLRSAKDDFGKGLGLAGEKHRGQTESKRGQFERRALHVSDAVSTWECNATGLANSAAMAWLLFRAPAVEGLAFDQSPVKNKNQPHPTQLRRHFNICKQMSIASCHRVIVIFEWPGGRWTITIYTPASLVAEVSRMMWFESATASHPHSST